MQLSHALPALPRQESHSGELAVLKDKHRGLVARIKPYRISYGESKEGDEVLWHRNDT